jgi:2'-hydroxyisoflavone reductase
MYVTRMRVLVLGGTQFIGRHIVEQLHAANHHVTIFNRGQKLTERTAAEHLFGDRDLGASGLTALANGQWDACVDTSGYTPLQVRASTTLLRPRVRHYVYMSTASVYAPGARLPAKESAAVLPTMEESVTEITQDTYGRLKATCEGIVREQFGAEHTTILRPQIVAGPHDHTGRYAYWVDRVTRGGTMLGPGDGTDPLQVVDVRDLARFAVRCVEQNLSSCFNISGHRMPWSEFLALLGARSKNVVWVSKKHLKEQDADFTMLPLYRAADAQDAHGANMSSEKAEAAGFVRTPAADTRSAVKAWMATAKSPIPSDARFLSQAKERELIALAEND